MRTPTLLVVVLILSVFAGCSRNTEGKNFTHVEAQDPGMNAAIAKGKASVADFIRAFHSQKPGTKNYYVKKPFPTPAGKMEHMWIEVLEEEKGIIKGRVANDAEETREVKVDQLVTLRIPEISDWQYQDGAKLIGGFTIRYFYDRMTPKEKEAFLKEAGFEL